MAGEARVRIPVCCWWALLVGLAFLCGPTAAQEATKEIPRAHHPWGRFEPGAWKLVRVHTETLDEEGRIQSASSSETRTTLLEIEADGVTLCAEVLVEVAGKRFDATPQTVKQGFHGELASPELRTKSEGPAQVTVEGRKIPCQIEQLELVGPTSKTVTRLYYSPSVTPYVLRRETVATDMESKNTLHSTLVELVALGMPCRVLGEIKTGVCVKTVHQHAKGTITTLALTCDDVPGGVVFHSAKETDQNSRLVRRSTLELVNYGLEPEEERTGLFGRKRPGRSRKPGARPGSF